MNNRKPLAFLALGALGLVALIAVANALWFQVLTINAKVTTSELKVGWQGFVCSDNEPSGTFISAGWPRQTKEVASFTPPQLDPTFTFFPDPVTITVINAYPGYAVDCEVEFVNLAPVPVHLERVVITVDDPTTLINPDYTTECLDGTCKTFANGPDLYDLNPLTPPDPTYEELVGIPVGCQFEQEGTEGGSFKFGVRQSAKEQTTYIIKLSLQFNQWNESGFTGCNTPKHVPPTPVLPLDNGTPCDPILQGIAQQPCINPTATPLPV